MYLLALSLNWRVTVLGNSNNILHDSVVSLTNLDILCLVSDE